MYTFKIKDPQLLLQCFLNQAYSWANGFIRNDTVYEKLKDVALILKYHPEISDHIEEDPINIKFWLNCFLPFEESQKDYKKNMIIETGVISYRMTSVYEYFILTRGIIMKDCEACIPIWNKIEYPTNPDKRVLYDKVWNIVGPHIRRLNNTKSARNI
jgi:hypothetical protein